jgi:hypothetical protein
MKIHVLLAVALLTAAGLISCQQKQRHTAKPVQKKPVELITYPCSIVISPTLKQIDKMKKDDGEDYDSIIDDDVYYQSQSGQYIDSIKLKKIEKYATGSITFKTTNGKLFTIDLSKYTFAVLLFNGKTKPVEADMVDFAASYKGYMK